MTVLIPFQIPNWFFFPNINCYSKKRNKTNKLWNLNQDCKPLTFGSRSRKLYCPRGAICFTATAIKLIKLLIWLYSVAVSHKKLPRIGKIINYCSNAYARSCLTRCQLISRFAGDLFFFFFLPLAGRTALGEARSSTTWKLVFTASSLKSEPRAALSWQVMREPQRRPHTRRMPRSF